MKGKNVETLKNQFFIWIIISKKALKNIVSVKFAKYLEENETKYTN